MIRKWGQGIGSNLAPASIAFLIPGLDVADASTWSAEYANQFKVLSAIFLMLGFFFQFNGYQFINPIGKREELEIEQAIKI